jgi:hypothetical protein
LGSSTKLKNQFFHYENASKFHNDVRNIFITDDFFKQLQCFQEVPVSFLVDTYPNNNDAVDWYIRDYNCIIELHGKQHYEMVKFSNNNSYFENKKEFHNIQFRDNRKKTALLEAGFFYLEISYKDAKKINADFLKQKIFSLGD